MEDAPGQLTQHHSVPFSLPTCITEIGRVKPYVLGLSYNQQ